MAVSSIQLGQVWRSDADGQDYLVTKVYSEVFTQYAMLRPAGITAPDAPTVRIKVTKTPQGAALPGYTFTQEGSFYRSVSTPDFRYTELVLGSQFSIRGRR